MDADQVAGGVAEGAVAYAVRLVRRFLDHLGLPANLRGNIETHYYNAGHMMYVRLPDLEKLRRDVREFYAKADGLK